MNAKQYLIGYPADVAEYEKLEDYTNYKIDRIIEEIRLKHIKDNLYLRSIEDVINILETHKTLKQ